MRFPAQLIIPIGVAFAFCVSAQPAPMSGFADEGAFRLYFNDDYFARAVFHWSEDGRFENELTLSLAGQSLKTNVAITPDDSGRWTKAVFEDRTFERSGSDFRAARNQEQTLGRFEILAADHANADVPYRELQQQAGVLRISSQGREGLQDLRVGTRRIPSQASGRF